MNDNIYKFVATLIGGAFLAIGMVWGMSSLKIIIPVVLLIIAGTFAYQAKKHKLESQGATNAFYLAVMAIIVIFILVGLGNCIGGCTKGGGDTRQQRIEMGLPPY